MDDKQLGSLLNVLCQQALAEDKPSVPPARLFTRAAKGQTITQGATTITLSDKAVELLRQIVSGLREDRDVRMKLSAAEVENEVVNTLFEGTEALEKGHFDEVALTRSFRSRLNDARQAWDIYLPIAGLILPPGRQLSLAGGIIKELTADERQSLKDEYLKLGQSGRENEAQINKLAEGLDSTFMGSPLWFHIVVEGRSEGAHDLALEKVALAMDILRFWSLSVGIDPEMSAIGLPLKAITGNMKSFQFVRGLRWQEDIKASVVFPYQLDNRRHQKLTALNGFKLVQAMSNKLDPSGVEQKFLLGIQQYAEACQLPTLPLKLVWFLSALETVIVKDTEGSRHEKVERRMRAMLGDKVGDLVPPLYDKRRKPVHYGTRNRIGDELVGSIDVQTARDLAYLGIATALDRVSMFTDHAAFVDALGTLAKSQTT